MTARLLTWAERPDLAERGLASEDVWPEYNLHGDVFDEWWTPLLEELPQYHFAVYDDAADVVLAELHTGPLSWNGDDRELPDGIDDALQRVVCGHRAGAPIDTLCALAAEVAPTARQLVVRFVLIDRKLPAGGELGRIPSLEVVMRPTSVFVRDLLPEEGDRLRRLSRKAASEVSASGR